MTPLYFRKQYRVLLKPCVCVFLALMTAGCSYRLLNSPAGFLTTIISLLRHSPRHLPEGNLALTYAFARAQKKGSQPESDFRFLTK